MTDEERHDFTDLLVMMAERTTTLSVRFEALRVLLEERGVFSADDFEKKNAELRAHWDLQHQPHVSLSGLEIGRAHV